MNAKLILQLLAVASAWVFCKSGGSGVVALYHQKYLRAQRGHKIVVLAAADNGSALIRGTRSASGAEAKAGGALGRSVANTLGYIMGAYAFFLYVPIIRDILQRGAEGVSLQTWTVNVASFSLALIYPIKKGYALSTFVEVLGLQLQSLLILGLAALSAGKLGAFLAGVGILAAAMGVVLRMELSPRLLSSIQLVRLALDGYSLLPQICLNFRNGAFSYNAVTASASLVGNGIRIFTTLTLVKDPLVLAGYVVGLASNLVLLLQYIWFRKSKAG